ncbi:MAG: hypothetical protein AABX38_06675 [Candidatus Micrarchaeota archaeon]
MSTASARQEPRADRIKLIQNRAQALHSAIIGTAKAGNLLVKEVKGTDGFSRIDTTAEEVVRTFVMFTYEVGKMDLDLEGVKIKSERELRLDGTDYSVERTEVLFRNPGGNQFVLATFKATPKETSEGQEPRFEFTITEYDDYCKRPKLRTGLTEGIRK